MRNNCTVQFSYTSFHFADIGVTAYISIRADSTKAHNNSKSLHDVSTTLCSESTNFFYEMKFIYENKLLEEVHK